MDVTGSPEDTLVLLTSSLPPPPPAWSPAEVEWQPLAAVPDPPLEQPTIVTKEAPVADSPTPPEKATPPAETAPAPQPARVVRYSQNDPITGAHLRGVGVVLREAVDGRPVLIAPLAQEPISVHPDQVEPYEQA